MAVHMVPRRLCRRSEGKRTGIGESSPGVWVISRSVTELSASRGCGSVQFSKALFCMVAHSIVALMVVVS